MEDTLYLRCAATWKGCWWCYNFRLWKNI